MANPDFESLLNSLLPFAQEMLAKHGEFFPFGMTMSLEGQIAAEAAYDGTEQPASEELIQMLTQTFRHKASMNLIRAAGICCDIRTIPPGETKKTDAICVSLEHQSGDAGDVCLPYKKSLLGKITYGDLFGGHRTPEFFVKV